MNFDVLAQFPNLRVLSLRQHQIKTEAQIKYMTKILSLPKLQNLIVDIEAEEQIFKTFEDKLITGKVSINKHKL